MALFFLAAILCSASILHIHCLPFGLFIFYYLEVSVLIAKMGRNKRKTSGGDKEPPASSDPPRKGPRPKTRGEQHRLPPQEVPLPR